MQSLFISPVEIQSPRWQQAFPLAKTLSTARELPANLQTSLIWVMLGDEFNINQIAQWVAAGARVIALTAVEDSVQAKRALEVGAHGYLHYLAAVPVLLQVKQVVEAGGLWLGVDLMRQLVFATSHILNAAPINATREKNHLDLLSAREQEVAKAVAAGKTNKEVARELAITERTVKAHLSAVFEKLAVRDRLHLVLVLSERQ
jgi:DNA-binding NarL/FixJ family response regulator